MNVELGRTYTDKITGFTGVAIGRVEYLTGCNQALLQPSSDDPRKRPDSEWFDDQRLDHVEGPVVTLDNGKNPGCDKAAPKA